MIRKFIAVCFVLASFVVSPVRANDAVLHADDDVVIELEGRLFYELHHEPPKIIHPHRWSKWPVLILRVDKPVDVFFNDGKKDFGPDASQRFQLEFDPPQFAQEIKAAIDDKRKVRVTGKLYMPGTAYYQTTYAIDVQSITLVEDGGSIK